MNACINILITKGEMTLDFQSVSASDHGHITKNKHFFHLVHFTVSLKQKKQVPKSQGVTYHQNYQFDECCKMKL